MKRILIVSLCILLSLFSYGQADLPNTPSASVGNYSKYADIEPNLYNGATSVPISIAQVSEGPLRVGVGISYHSSGIRAHELSSEIGLGWSLQAGGVITRRVRGIPDERDEGYVNTGHEVQGYTNQTLPQSVKDDLESGDTDGEADIFAYNVGGIAGKFVFDHNGNIHTIPDSDVLIEADIRSDNSMAFKITNTDGTQYFFGPVDLVNPTNYSESNTFYSNGSYVDDYISSWYLHKISTHDNLHQLDINYIEDNYSYYSLQDCYIVGAATTCEMEALRVDVSTQLISSISTSTGSVHFDYADDRQDMVNGARRLYRIRSTEGTKTTNYDFTQSYFTDNTTEPVPDHLGIPSSHKDELGKRLKLDEIAISGGSESIPSYEFEYYGRASNQTNASFFPSQVTQAIDHWGYFNGALTNNDQDHIIPETSVICTTTVTKGISTIGRVTDEQEMHAGSLSKITYPLGGSTTFGYGSNEYFKPDTINTSTSINSVGTACTTQQEFFTTHSFTQVELDHGELILYSTPVCSSTAFAVVSILLSGQTVASLTTSGLSAQQANLVLSTSSLQVGVSYSIKITLYSSSVDLDLDVYATGTNERCGGLRLEKITTDDNNGTDIIRDFEYSISESSSTESSGVLYRQPQYGLLNGAGCTGTWIFGTNSVAGLQSFEGYHVGYSSAKVNYNGNGSKRIDFFNDLSPDAPFYFPPTPENDREYVGQTQSTTVRNQSGQVLSTQSQVLKQGSFNNDIGSQMVLYSTINGGIFKIYNVHSGKYIPEKTEAFQEGIGIYTEYTYNGLSLFPTEVTTKDEDDNELVFKQYRITNIYTGDNSTTVDPYFDSTNIVMPFYEKTYINGDLAQTTTTHYDLFNGFARPDKIEIEDKLVVDQTTLLSTSITDFKTYDSKGNLTAIRYEGDLLDHTYEYYTNNTLKKACFGALCTEYEYVNSNQTQQLSKKINVDGTSMSYTYDGLRRLSTITDDNTSATTTTTYHLSNTSKSYTKTINTYSADPLGLSLLTSMESRNYVDGLGRSIQTVGVGQAPSDDDQVVAMSYDNQGRPSKTYELQEVGANNGAYVTPSASWKYDLQTYEASPLNRSYSQTPIDWYESYTFHFVNRISVDSVYDYSLSIYYPDSVLFKTMSLDPEFNKILQFTDVQGRLILSRHTDSGENDNLDTYYLYDTKNQLVQVIPPGSTKDDAHLNYYYEYDAKGRTTRKKVPSKDWIDYVYNDRDLVTAQQDAHLRAKDQWYAHTYDIYNRQTHSGFHNSTTAPTTDNPTLNRVLTKTDYSYATGNTSLGKVVQSWTKNLDTDDWLRSYNNYDQAGRLSFITANSHLSVSNGIADLQDSTIVYYDGASNVVKTRNRIKVNSTDINIIEDYSYLDDDGRIIKQWISLNGAAQQLNQLGYNEKNQLSAKVVGGNLSNHLQLTTYEYLPNGLLSSVNGGAATGTQLYGYQLNYDNVPTITNSTNGTVMTQRNGLISSIQWSSINEPTQLIVYQYDVHDRLTDSYTNSGLYDSSYEYDQRGNFTAITRYADIDGVSTVIDSLAPSYKSTNANQMERMNESALTDKGYKSNSTDAYMYDANGNMTRDPQKGINIHYNHMDLQDTITWDDGRMMTMTYTGDGSLLQRSLYDISDTLIQVQDYFGTMEYLNKYPYIIYHAEGRFVNEGVEAYLEYLYLDHQQELTGQFKAGDIESEGQIMEESTDYMGASSITLVAGFEVDSLAEFTATITPPPSYQLSWRQEWDVRDHLGNLRIVYTDQNGDGIIQDTDIVQRQTVYPFGLSFEKSVSNSLESTRQYNGIEYVKEYGLGWHMAPYRSLASDISIWNSVDPMAEHDYASSPYAVNYNNPITYTDPDGDCPICPAIPAIIKALGVIGPTATITASASAATATIVAATAATGATIAATSAISSSNLQSLSNSISGPNPMYNNYGYIEQTMNYGNWNVDQLVSESAAHGKGTLYQTHYGYQRGSSFAIKNSTIRTFDPVRFLQYAGGPDQIATEGLKWIGSGALLGGLYKSGNFLWRAKNAAKTSTKLWPAASNGRTVINGIEYTTHALERMQPVGTIMKGTKVFSRGVPPSAVENAIKFGKVTPGNTAAEVVRTFENVRVITNPQGTRVISVIKMGH